MIALQEAQGDWVAITDIDVRPERDWIEQLLVRTSPLVMRPLLPLREERFSNPY